MLSRVVFGSVEAAATVVLVGVCLPVDATTVLLPTAVVAELPPASPPAVNTFVVKPISPITRIVRSSTCSGRTVERSRRGRRVCVRYGWSRVSSA